MSIPTELNAHFGLTPANVVAVDYRGPNGATVTYIDPNGGLQSMLLADAKGKEKCPPHFNSDNPMGVDFNYQLIAGFLQTGEHPEFTEVFIKGAAGRIAEKFDVKGLSILAIGEDFRRVVGNIPDLLYRSIKGQRTVIIAPKSVGAEQYAKAILALKGQAGRPSGPDAPKVDPATLDT